MKIAYFDCFAGISGDMILGALIDAGLNVNQLKKELNKLSLSPYEFKTSRVKKNGIGGANVVVVGKEEERARGLEEILNIIDKSKLDAGIKEKAKQIFNRLAAVEAKIHRKRKRDIHFHELSGLDTIIDVVGALIGIKLLKIERVYSSSLHLGSGFVKCQHGTLPVPAPATLELLKGVPVYGRDIEAELVTPTGAVLITALASHFGEIPSMKIEKVGYGAGNRNLPIPNLLRIFIGDAKEVRYKEDKVYLVETNIDDMNPLVYGYLMDTLFQKGALDVWFTPIQMKKNRPAIALSLLSEERNLEDLCETIFRETTTIGARFSRVKRKYLKREERIIKTKYGKIKVKLAMLDKVVKQISPDYDECRKIAEKLDIPLKDVYEEAKRGERFKT